MPLSNCQFRESRYSKNRTLRKVVNEIFPIFSSDLEKKISRGDVHENVSSDSEFCENWSSEFHILVRGLKEFLPYFHEFVCDLGEIRCKRSAVEHCEFRENRRRQGHTFLMGVNEISFTRVP